MSSPHTRGWSAALERAARSNPVFPAYEGVSRAQASAEGERSHIPRIHGVEPIPCLEKRCSLHMQGYSGLCHVRYTLYIRRGAPMPKPLKVFPHVGVSVSPVGQQRPQRCSPGIRGCPQNRTSVSVPLSGAVSLCRSCRSHWVACPHIHGVDPKSGNT